MVTTAREPEPARIRLAELVAALSLGVDLGFGQPMEHVLRECIIALRLADRVGLDDDARSVVYFTALLVNVACHSDAYEQAKWFGDDIAFKSGKYDDQGVRAALATLRMLGSGNPPLHRVRVGVEFAAGGFRAFSGMIAQHAALARGLAARLGLSDAVQEAVGSSYEQWNGKGWPGKLEGAHIPIAARITQLAEFVEVAHRLGGDAGAVVLADARSGSQFDPDLAKIICVEPEPLFEGLDAINTWDEVIGVEPSLGLWVSGEQFDAALEAVANFVDLKSPYTLGHARAVAALAADAGQRLGMSDESVRTLHRAGLVHDFGRLGVSNAIWDKPGPLGAGEWERVRMHPYLTERMLHQADALRPLGEIAVQHHERLDGSGYPRGLSGGAIGSAARVLGAADAYQSMCEPRPYRDALTPDAAAAELHAEVKAGRLEREAVDAVLAAAGHRVAKRRAGPAGLTAREIDVLRLLARGCSSKEIAKRLVISPKTARNHIEHIYAKTGTSNRVLASMFAVDHGLIPEGDGALAP
jgi:HD-GYP domain-containing protein (c-di-GMP phosphodiesterase class II)